MNKLLLVSVSSALLCSCAPFAQLIAVSAEPPLYSTSIEFPDGVHDGGLVEIQLGCDSFRGTLMSGAPEIDPRFELYFMQNRGFEYFSILEGVSENTIACAIRYNNRAFFGEGRCIDDDAIPFIISF